jgi:protein tyrosine/serine phosphatase
MIDLPSFAPAPPALDTKERVRAALDMWFVDHGFIRDIYCNRHRITDTAWRSAQPAPHHLRSAQRLGIKTIVNLRGRRDDCGSYILEREACHKLGLILVDFPIRSRGALEKPTLLAAAKLFPQLRYPVLFHCKSGADRAGMMSTLYLHLHEGVKLERAMKQLSLAYGHVKQARTGVIDYFFARYLNETRDRKMTLLEWVDECYDAAELNKSFRENRLARFIVNDILRRE